MMKKTYKRLACLCAALLLLSGSSVNALGAMGMDGPLRVWGPVVKESDGTDTHFLNMDNQSEVSMKGEVRITVSDTHTRVIDAVTGLPMTFDEIADGETAYAYIGPAVTMSLPPIMNSSLVLCRVPAGYKVPDYLQVEQLTWNADQTCAALLAADGTSYTIPAGCPITPYRTRNIVTLADLTAGRDCLVWSDDSGQVSRILLFSSDETAGQEPSLSETGWKQLDGQWYYYDASGNLASGWQLIDGKWYYLDPDTCVMRTGFITLEGKTYYLQEDGSMLTSARVFTPDGSGALH